MVEAGQVIRITKHGRPVARLVPDQRFMSGKEFARLFAGYKADALDKAAADEIANNIAQLDAEVEDAMAPSVVDGLLAAIAIRTGATVATRNETDFKAIGCPCANPLIAKQATKHPPR